MPVVQQKDPLYKRHVAGYYRCLACSLDFTVRSGTSMKRSHIPLKRGFYGSTTPSVASTFSTMQTSSRSGSTKAASSTTP